MTLLECSALHIPHCYAATIILVREQAFMSFLTTFSNAKLNAWFDVRCMLVLVFLAEYHRDQQLRFYKRFYETSPACLNLDLRITTKAKLNASKS